MDRKCRSREDQHGLYRAVPIQRHSMGRLPQLRAAVESVLKQMPKERRRFVQEPPPELYGEYVLVLHDGRSLLA